MDTYLPVLVNVVDFKEHDELDTYSVEDVCELEDLITAHLDGDCHAVVLDGEVLFNSYRPMTHRERINDYIIHEQLVKHARRHLIVPMLRRHVNFAIEIFMFRENPWKIVIDFDEHTQLFHVQKKV